MINGCGTTQGNLVLIMKFKLQFVIMFEVNNSIYPYHNWEILLQNFLRLHLGLENKVWIFCAAELKFGLAEFGYHLNYVHKWTSG